jgi:hypothetical protein
MIKNSLIKALIFNHIISQNSLIIHDRLQLQLDLTSLFFTNTNSNNRLEKNTKAEPNNARGTMFISSNPNTNIPHN